MELPLDERLDLPYSFDRVWTTALLPLQQAKCSVTRANKETGGIEVHVVMDMLTWTETFYLNLTKISDNRTGVVMGRIGLAQPLDWGIARRFIESLLNKLESTLRDTSQNPTL
jgi:hypothetical protein